MEETGWDWNYLCNERYDIIIHLVTSAKGAENYYGSITNKYRLEDNK